jgi:acetyl esterase/lipase
VNALLTAALLTACTTPRVDRPVSWTTVSEAPRPVASHRIHYGEGPEQFGELWLPDGAGPFPVVVLIHGGCWLSEYDIGYMARAAADLSRRGMAVWSLEYRRVGDAGGGWPGTFRDAAAGADHVRELAGRFPLDTGRIALSGHSAGGHLALWLAGRHNLPESAPLYSKTPIRPLGVVALAGIADLGDYSQGSGGCNRAVEPLMGGMPAGVPDRYAQADPIRLLPLGVPLRLVQGELDPIVPTEQARRMAEAAARAGDRVDIMPIPGEGHFDVVDPGSRSWQAAADALEEILSP